MTSYRSPKGDDPMPTRECSDCQLEYDGTACPDCGSAPEDSDLRSAQRGCDTGGMPASGFLSYRRSGTVPLPCPLQRSNDAEPASEAEAVVPQAQITVAYVLGHHALEALAELATVEHRIAREYPDAAERVGVIVDQVATVMAEIVQSAAQPQ